ncbi:MAG: TetR/AcrR family transcriptional regulator [Candidatus Sericytochromatia bacterium]|nr:TetR/AcrR family transcriptional regulator [Candidatus Sericytochromatia bacterium]
MARLSALPSATPSAIVAAAAELFRKHGYAGTSIQQVSAAAGLSKGNLTYHFPSKRELFEAVQQEALRYVEERVMERSFAEGPDTLSSLEEFARRLRRLFVDDTDTFVGCLFTNVAMETRHADRAVADMARQSMVVLRERVARHLARGQELGEVRGDLPPEVLARMFFWLYEGALTMARALEDSSEYDLFRSSLRQWFAPAAARTDGNGTSLPQTMPLGGHQS